MSIIRSEVGKLHIMVASEGNVIREGTMVIIETIVDNFKNIYVEVRSAFKTVKLSYYETDIDWLLGK